MYALTKNEEIRGHRLLSQRGNHGMRGLLPSPEMGRDNVSLILCFVTTLVGLLYHTVLISIIST